MIGLARTREQEELRASVRDALAAAPEQPGGADEDGYELGRWRAVMNGIGAGAIAVSENRGGAGYGLGEISVLFEEAGRALAKMPLLATLGLAQPLLTRCSGTVADEAVARIVDGASATVAVDSLTGGTSTTPTVRARPDAGRVRLEGSVGAVIFGHATDQLLVPAQTDSGIRLFLVERADLADTPVTPGLDPTQPTARVHLTDTPGRPLKVIGETTAALAYMQAHAAICLAADSLGGAQACLETTVEYVRTREQFGRPIGSFQAIKHRLADVALAIRRAEGLVIYAALSADTTATFELDAAVGKAAAAEAYLLAAKENIQMHGGIGFTWELGAHFHLKRATTNDLTLGAVRAQRTVIADILRDALGASDSPALTRRPPGLRAGG